MFWAPSEQMPIAQREKGRAKGLSMQWAGNKGPEWWRYVLLLTVTLAVIAAGALWAHHESRIGAIRERFEQAGREAAEESGGRWCDTIVVMKLLGEGDGKAFLSGISERYSNFVYDGQSRFCQILRHVHYTEGQPEDRGKQDLGGDGLLLSLLEPLRGSYRPKSIWSAPPRARIEQVHFEADGLRVEYVLGAYGREGGASETLTQRTYLIPWRPGEDSGPGNLPP